MGKGIVERRSAPRKNTNVSINMHSDLLGKMINISETGACFFVNKPLQRSNFDFTFELPDRKLIKAGLQVVWKKHSYKQNQYQYGGHFFDLNDNAKDTLREFLFSENSIIQDSTLRTSEDVYGIVSEEITYKNRAGQRVIGFYDHLQKDTSYITESLVVIPPAYGETKRDSLTISYYLVRNGFHVVRYDACDHLGESDGDIYFTTMEKLANDVLSCLDFVQNRFFYKNIGIVTTSLGFRAALKAIREEERVRFLLGLVGIINLQHTFYAVYHEDIIGDIQKGNIKEEYDLLGHIVNKEFPINSIDKHFHDFQSTRDDLAQIDAPVIILSSQKDVWVDIDDVETLVKNSGENIQLHMIPDTMHQLFENPQAAKLVMKRMVCFCHQYLKGNSIPCDDIEAPSRRQIAYQNRIEKERLKKMHAITAEDEKEFWEQYMLDFSMLKKVDDYTDFLKIIIELLGGYQEGEVFLDAGCGIGYVGIWLLLHLKDNYQKTISGTQTPFLSYIGGDFVKESIRKAQQNHKAIIGSVLGDIKPHFIDYSYTLFDLNAPLKYPDNSFHKICCSLVLSYVNDPMVSMRELFRVLKPGGKMVITSLKPHPDISQIHRNFLNKAKNKDEIREMRKLISNAGQIKRKEGEGHYQFFSQEELEKMVQKVGAEYISTHRSFGNQANLILATKNSKIRGEL